MKNQHPDESITFLGTGGSRFVTASQVVASGGLWLKLNGTEILVDPGPGCIVQSTQRGFKAERLSGIILSHRHLDHSADLNIMVEAMTGGRTVRNGHLFLPSDALGTEPVIFSYLKEYLESIEILTEGGSYRVGNVSFTTPLRHQHRVETYGMVFRTAGHTFSCITDSRYFDGLRQNYAADLLIINITFLEPRPPSFNPRTPADHLSVPDAAYLIKELQPKAAILTHFGTSVLHAGPGLVAQWVTEQTGVRVIAASDGMRFDLAELD